MKTFKPDDLKPVATLSNSDMFNKLDQHFHDLVKQGWWSNNFRDRISVIVSRQGDEDLYVSVIANCYEIMEYYNDAGWAKVTVETSESKGERPGLVVVELTKQVN